MATEPNREGWSEQKKKDYDKLLGLKQHVISVLEQHHRLRDYLNGNVKGDEFMITLECSFLANSYYSTAYANYLMLALQQTEKILAYFDEIYDLTPVRRNGYFRNKPQEEVDIVVKERLKPYNIWFISS